MAVIPALQGGDALYTLEKKKRKVHLVMIHTKLPDMCAFELAQILESRFKMPVVMICDTYPESAMLRSVSKGAMYCLSMPLCMEDIANLWQHPVIKKKYYMGETRLSSISGNSSQSWNEGFTWTPYINCKFLDIVWNFGIYDVAPSEVLRLIDAPGLTIRCVIDKLEEFRTYLRRQQELQLNSIPIIAHMPPHIANHLMDDDDDDIYSIPAMAYALQQPAPLIEYLEGADSEDELDSDLFKWPITAEDYANLPGLEEMQMEQALIRLFPHFSMLLPSMFQLPPPPPVPRANTVQMFFQSVNEDPPLNMAPPVPGRGEDDRKHGDQAQSQPAWFTSPGQSPYPPASSEM
ncbi:two-component response regulator ARR10 isoform X3 [Beta vulgaris subsp. vulgaris]|uniref:two-component response regulator ARR10 isoform X3 n=1 Tax=Beta vulgaris subsp. vulgaris TaxID=3555 RepID=UPI00203719ED|nr:two-component response regulator ARR10 isoform X3 [Beta vulgaris subsp. vulgaris]